MHTQTDNGNESGGQMLKQYVWGLQYIDELCQVGVNQDPNNATYALNGEAYYENEAEYYYYPLQDANYNNLGVITAAGRLVERYEYTPYGQRTVYSHGVLLPDITGDRFVGIEDMNAYLAGDPRADLNGDGSVGISDLNIILGNWNQGTPANDPLVTYPTLHSARELKMGFASLGLTNAPLCEVGHQGLFHDEEFGAQGGLIQNRARTLHPRLGRFMQRDPLGVTASNEESRNPSSVGIIIHKLLPIVAQRGDAGVSQLLQFAYNNHSDTSIGAYSPIRQYGDGLGVYLPYISNPNKYNDSKGMAVGGYLCDCGVHFITGVFTAFGGCTCKSSNPNDEGLGFNLDVFFSTQGCCGVGCRAGLSATRCAFLGGSPITAQQTAQQDCLEGSLNNSGHYSGYITCDCW